MWLLRLWRTSLLDSARREANGSTAAFIFRLVPVVRVATSIGATHLRAQASQSSIDRWQARAAGGSQPGSCAQLIDFKLEVIDGVLELCILDFLQLEVVMGLLGVGELLLEAMQSAL